MKFYIVEASKYTYGDFDVLSKMYKILLDYKYDLEDTYINKEKTVKGTIITIDNLKSLANLNREIGCSIIIGKAPIPDILVDTIDGTIIIYNDYLE